MSLQPAFDQIACAAFRRGLNPLDAEMSWETAPDGNGVFVEFEFQDGTVLKGYAPDGMASFEAGAAAEKAERRRGLTVIDGGGPVPS